MKDTTIRDSWEFDNEVDISRCWPADDIYIQ
jgi:hypothetical protein